MQPLRGPKNRIRSQSLTESTDNMLLLLFLPSGLVNLDFNRRVRKSLSNHPFSHVLCAQQLLVDATAGNQAMPNQKRRGGGPVGI